MALIQGGDLRVASLVAIFISGSAILAPPGNALDSANDPIPFKKPLRVTLVASEAFFAIFAALIALSNILAYYTSCSS